MRINLKHLISCALLVLPVMVCAQEANVTLYGIVDLGISTVHVSRNIHAKGGVLDKTQVGIDSGVQSGSRWGLRMVEPINDDLALNFLLESGVNAQNGTQGQGNRAFGRQSTLGVSSKQFGQVDLGRQMNVASRYFLAIDPFGLGFGQSNLGASFGSANSLRYDNTIMLQSRTSAGFQCMVGYAFNVGQSAIYAQGPNTNLQPATENFGSMNNIRAVTAGVRYGADDWLWVASFDAALASSQVQSVSDSGVNTSNPNASTPITWALGTKYGFGRVQLSAAVGQGFNGAFSGQGPGNGLSGSGLATFTGGAGILFDAEYDYQSMMIGATLSTSEDGKILASLQMMQPKGQLRERAGYATQSILGLAYTYILSKRTNLYVWGSIANNFQMISTAKSQVIGVGIRHLF